MAEKQNVAGKDYREKEYYELDGQLLEIKRQLRLSDGYPYDVKKLRTALQDVVEGKFNFKQFPTWMTINTGYYGKDWGLPIPYYQVAKILKHSGYELTSEAEELFQSLKGSDFSHKETLELVKIPLDELGHKGYSIVADELEWRVEEIGLRLCPPCVGFELRMRIPPNDPVAEWLLVGTKPLYGKDGKNKYLFCLERGTNLHGSFDGWGPRSREIVLAKK